jgi:hypothetical protein
MAGAALFQRRTFLAVASNRAAGWQAAVVVAIAAATHVVGGIRLASAGGWNPVFSMLPSLPWEFALWLGGAASVYLVGAKLYGLPLRWQDTARMLGFAFVPCLLNVWMTIPAIPMVMEVWRLAIALVALHLLLDTTKPKLLLTFLLGAVGAWVSGVLVTILTLYLTALFL